MKWFVLGWTLLVVVILSPLRAQESVTDSPSDQLDYSRLAHPEVARQLEMTDIQLVEIQRILNARAVALAGAEASQRDEIARNAQRELDALLTQPQRDKLVQLVAEKKLTFSFTDQHWREVLEWFSEQAGLTLVYDRLPEQNFNYRDSRPYTTRQAIDLLNGILLSKGFTLIRQGNLLIVADITERLPNEMIPEINVTELSQFGQFEIVRIVFPIGERPAEGVVSEIQPLIGTFGNVVALPQTKKVIVSETAGKMKAIQTLIASIPEPKPASPSPPASPPPAPVFAVYRVEGIDATAAMAILGELVPDAKLSSDDSAQQISAFAVPAQQEAIAAAVEQMKANLTAELRARLQTYPLPKVDIEALTGQLTAIAPNARISIDSDQKRVMVFGSPADHEQISAAMTMLGVRSNASGTTGAIVHALEHIKASELVALLTPLYPDGQLSASPDDRAVVARLTEEEQQEIQQLVERLDVEKEELVSLKLQHYSFAAQVDTTFDTILKALVPEVVTNWDSQRRRLMVLAPAEDHERIRQAAAEYTEGRPRPEPARVAVYPLAPSLQKTVVLLASQLVPDARLTWEADQERFLVVADQASQKRLESIIEEVSKYAPEIPELAIRVYSFEPRLRQRFLTLVKNIDERKQPIQVIDDNLPGELAVSTTPEQHARVQQLLTELATPIDERERLALRAYPVQHAEPSSLASLMSELFPFAQVVADEDARRLMVWATKIAHGEFAEAVQQLDVPDAGKKLERLVSYSIEGTSLEIAVGVLRTEFPEMILTPDQTNQRVLAWGTELDHARLEIAIEKLSQDVGGGEVSLDVYSTAPFDSRTVANAIKAAVLGIRSTSNLGDDVLLVVASAEQHEQVRHVVEQLADVQHGGEAGALIPVAYAAGGFDAEIVLQAVQSSVSGTRMASVVGGQTVLVVADAERHEQVRKVIEQLANVQHTGDANRLVPVVYSTGEFATATVRTALKTAVPDLRSVGVLGSDRLLVVATAEQHEQVHEVLAGLADVQHAVEPSPSMPVVYQTEDFSASTIRDAVQATVPEVGSMVAVDDTTLLVITSPEQHARIREIVDGLLKLGQTVDGSRMTPVVYSTGELNATTVSGLVQGILPSSRYVSVADPATLLVSASLDEHRSVQELIDGLAEQSQLAGPRGLVLEMYRTGDRDATTVRELVQQMVPAIGYTAVAGDDAIMVSASAEQHRTIRGVMDQLADSEDNDGRRRTVNAVYQTGDYAASTVLGLVQGVLPATRFASVIEEHSLVVLATPDEQEVVREVIGELLKSRPATIDRELKVYPLGDATAETVETAILGVSNADTKVTIDTTSNSLIVSADQSTHRALSPIIDSLLEQLPGKRLPVIRTYTLDVRDVLTAFTAIEQLMSGETDVTLALDEQRKTILATASEEKHEQLAELIGSLQQQSHADDEFGVRRRLAVYPVQNLDSQSVSTIVEALFADVTPIPRVEVTSGGNELLAVATDDQHRVIQEAIDSLHKPEREVEVFRLVANDAFDVELAIDGLFEDLAPSLAPAIESNASTQQLVARGTAEQMEEIRQLLSKMGESLTDFDPRTNVRVVPLNGNPARVMRQLEQLWPKLRDNQLRIVYPSDEGGRPVVPPASDRATDGESADANSSTPTVDSLGAPPAPLRQQLGEAPGETDSDEVPAEPPAPVTVVIDNNQVTISSDDEEAVQQFESLLRMLSPRPRFGQPNVMVYGLRHANAEELGGMLGEVFGGRSGRRSSSQVTVVPDLRLNSLIVRALSREHDLIESLIHALDVEDVFLETASTPPRLIPVENATASRIVELLESVYASELSAGGGRRTVSIPKGVSEEVANVLEQINASATGPLLSLATDQVTNLIIAQGPPRLLDELELFVHKLDTELLNRDSLGVRLVPLKTVRATVIQEILEEFLPKK